MSTLSPTALQLSPDGDYVWLCGACSHCASGIDPLDWSVDGAYPPHTVQGMQELAALLADRGAVLVPLQETSDSNLLSRCDVCGIHHSTGEWFEGYRADVAPARAPLPPVAAPAGGYVFYVGTSSHFDPHTDWSDGALLRITARAGYRADCYGVWGGREEHVTLYAMQLPDDSAAHRIAYALAAMSGNDAILVTRYARPDEDSRSMGSTRAYRVRGVETDTGNRTIVSDGNGGHRAYRFERDVKGSSVAWLVTSRNTVEEVN